MADARPPDASTGPDATVFKGTGDVVIDGVHIDFNRFWVSENVSSNVFILQGQAETCPIGGEHCTLEVYFSRDAVTGPHKCTEDAFEYNIDWLVGSTLYGRVSSLDCSMNVVARSTASGTKTIVKDIKTKVGSVQNPKVISDGLLEVTWP